MGSLQRLALAPLLTLIFTERGLRPATIIKVTGHRGWKSFQRYVNVTSDTVEQEFWQSWGQEPTAR